MSVRKDDKTVVAVVEKEKYEEIVENNADEEMVKKGKRERKMTTKGIMYMTDILQKTQKSKLKQIKEIEQKVEKLMSLEIAT